MNVLLFLGLVLFVILVFWLCFLFVSNTVETTTPKQAPKEPVYDDVLERCQKLYDQGFHAELQRFAQRELAKNYGDVELRKILAQSLMESGNEQMAIMHYEAILNINSYDIKTQEILAQYYSENGPKSKAINHYEQILMYDSGNINAVETLAKLYDEMQNYDKAIEMYQLILDAELDEALWIAQEVQGGTKTFEDGSREFKNVIQNIRNLGFSTVADALGQISLKDVIGIIGEI